jgi:hypothetical protein
MIAFRRYFFKNKTQHSSKIIFQEEEMLMIKYLQVPVADHGIINVEIEPTEVNKSVPMSGFEELGAKENIQKTTQAVIAEATNCDV